jgi:creatinine amidohydrolase
LPGRPYILAETTWKTVKDTPYEVALLPWGATEAHNYHLPYGTDTFQCDYVAAEAARLAWEQGARVIVLPTVPFGVNTGQLDIKLDVNMNPSTQAAVLRDVADALARQGFRKLVVMNGHGGNDFRQMLREIQAAYPMLFLCAVNWYQAPPFAPYFDDPGDHAGEMETSAMLHIAPSLVLPLAEAGDGNARRFKLRGLREGWVWAQRAWSQVTADTGVGDPSGASVEKGRGYLTDVTRQISGFLVELAASDPDDLYA